MNDIIQKREDIEKFYEFVKPSTLSPLVTQDNGEKFEKAIWPTTKEEFVERALEYNIKYNVYAPFRQIKEKRNTNNVIFLHNFVVDIDNDLDGEKAKQFEEYCERYKIKIGAKARSGGGYHFYIPYRKTIVTDDNRKELIRISNNFCQHVLDHKIDIDRHIFDLPRLIRVWGTWNHNKHALCVLDYLAEFTDEDVENNTVFINSLTSTKIDLTPVETLTVTQANCALMEYVEKNKLSKDNTEKNNVLLKNIAAYYYNMMGEEGYDIGIKVSKLQGKTEGEFRGWWSKAINEGFQYNCGEVTNWFKTHYAELDIHCNLCKHRNRNKVVYMNTIDSFWHLKPLMREKGKLIINREIVLKGKVQPYLNNKKEEVCIMQQYEVQGKDGEINFTSRFLDEPRVINKTAKLIKEVSVDLYTYVFINEGTNYLLFSEKELEYGDYFVEGSLVKLQDDLLIGNYGKTASKKKIIFCNNASPLLRKYKDVTELFESFNYTKEQLLNFLFYHKSEDRTYMEPDFINSLLLAFLFSGRKSYPLHLLISGPAGCGKSSIIEAINEKFDESNLDSGGASTIKNLVPSFGTTPPRIGSLLMASRLCFIDEFFGNIYQEQKNVSLLRMMNEVLESRERRYGSGKGTIEKAKMRAKMFGVTNPIEGMNFEETVRATPETVMSRIFVVNLGTTMNTWVNGKKSYTSGRLEPHIDVYSWLGVYDFLNGFISKYDEERVLDIARRMEAKVPLYMRSIYKTRYINHHVYLLLDGVIKTRCLFEKDDSFTAKEEDYFKFERLLETLVSNYNENVTTLTSEQDIVLRLIDGDGASESHLKEECGKRYIDYDYTTKVLMDLNLIYKENHVFKKVTETELSFEKFK